jgi:hypothetical protein
MRAPAFDIEQAEKCAAHLDLIISFKTPIGANAPISESPNPQKFRRGIVDWSRLRSSFN